MLKYSIILLASLLLISCTNWHSNIGLGHPASLPMEVDYGSAEYRQGYKDGCKSGWAAYTNSWNKNFFKWEQDPEQAQNRVYYQIWKDAYSYCAYYAMISDEHGLGNWR